jgi:8-oxo-dGTP diphosphatase
MVEMGESDKTTGLATVCFMRRNGKVLLQRRAPGRVWAGRLNGPGGKVDPGETPEAAVVREVAEETGVRLVTPIFHGQLDLLFGDPAVARLRVFVYTGALGEGRPRGGREGRLRWFAEDRLPYDELWPDMRYWLPIILAGGRVEGACSYDQDGERMLSCALHLTWDRAARG